MKIGILYPSSNVHPSIGIQFIDSIRKCFAFLGLNEKIILLPETIGFGSIEKEVYQKAERFLAVEGVDVLVAYIDLKAFACIEHLLIASGKLTVIVNPGANYPENWQARQNVVFLTLQQSFLCWLSGFEAAQNSNKNGLLATSFYDCGYLHSTAMVNNFVAAGGNITYNYINRQPGDGSFNINELLGFLSLGDNETNNVLCVFDTILAKLFYQHLSSLATASNLHLFVSPMMLENQALKNLSQTYPFDIHGFKSWDFATCNKANNGFADYYAHQTEQSTNIFLLQGWETALVLQKVFLLGNTNFANGKAVAKLLLNQPINSPRGILQLDGATYHYMAPFLKCHIAARTDKVDIKLVSDYKKEWDMFTNSIVDETSSGWVNTYLCY